MTETRPSATRFGFGDNWRNFIGDVSESRIALAEASLRERLEDFDVSGKTMLDVGCGSGLFSLAAVRLGAKEVRSFDFDPLSVEASRTLKRRYAPDAAWTIGQGDATDRTFMEALGAFDLVYSWGVLHHTGSMWQALALASKRVAADGCMFISIYNDQGGTSKLWRAVKRRYNRLPQVLRVPYAVVVMIPSELRSILSLSVRGRLGVYVRGWTEPRERGMSRWHDLLDWVGGYPFEVATPEEIFRFARDRGLVLRELKTCGGGLGCNEFVFRRTGSA
ncbi:MAG TPA: 50S ribosomal protein L11 methyltransferase [Galbitalea sp.]